MARIPFEVLFERHPDGALEPKKEVRIGGTTIRPGLKFNNISFGGVNLSSSQFLDHDFEVVLDKELSVITGIYKKNGR